MMRTYDSRLLLICLTLFLVACGGGQANLPDTETQVLEQICSNLVSAEKIDSRNQCPITIDPEEEITFMNNVDDFFLGTVDRAYVRTAMKGFVFVGETETEEGSIMRYKVRNRSTNNFEETLVFKIESDKLRNINLERN